MLGTVDPTWRTTHWLQLAVQGISDNEVPWYKLARSDGPQHQAVYDPGGGAGKCRQFPMVCGLFPCFAEGWGSHMRSTVVMASGEGTRGRSLPTGQGVLGRNRH